jgi:hypothetical protein
MRNISLINRVNVVEVVIRDEAGNIELEDKGDEGGGVDTTFRAFPGRKRNVAN